MVVNESEALSSIIHWQTDHMRDGLLLLVEGGANHLMPLTFLYKM